MDESAAEGHRSRMERAEASFGPLHYQAKVYTILRSPLELATHPRVLDTVSALIGPNVLLWNATYIVKEPHAPDHVSWHQDRVSCHASSGTSEFAMRVNARRGPQRISGILARTTTRQWRAWRAPEGRVPRALWPCCAPWQWAHHSRRGRALPQTPWDALKRQNSRDTTLAYWGLDGEDQVSMWLALSPANESAGGMRMVPGSHRAGRYSHRLAADASNVLYQGQTVEGVDESRAVSCTLRPGEASLHHGWTLHASTPNRSADRRIGFNAQYVATHLRQTQHDRDTALLVHGVDSFRHFGVDIPASRDFEPGALARQRELDRMVRDTMGDGTGDFGTRTT